MSKNIAYKHNKSVVPQMGTKSHVPGLKSYQVPEQEPSSNSNSDNEDANVSDDSDDAPRKGQNLESQPSTIQERPSLQEQAHLQFELNKQKQMPLFQLKKDNPLYSFSKNIDYSKITESQMRRHLKEKKQNSFQKIVPFLTNNGSFQTSFQRQKSESRKSVRFAPDENGGRDDKENSDHFKKIEVQSSDGGSGIFQGSWVVDNKNIIQYEEQSISSQPRISHLGQTVQPMTVFGDNSTPSFKMAAKDPIKKPTQLKKKKAAPKFYDAQSHRDIIQKNQSKKPQSAVLQPRTREFNQASNVQATSSILKNGANSYVTPSLPTKPKLSKRGVVASSSKTTKVQKKIQQNQKSSSIFNVQKPDKVIIQRIEIQNEGIPKTMTQMGVSPKSMMRYQSYTELTNESKKNAKDDILSEESQYDRRSIENHGYFKLDHKIASKKAMFQVPPQKNIKIFNNSSNQSTAFQQAPTKTISLVVCEDQKLQGFQKQQESGNSDSDYSDEDTQHPYSQRGSILPYARQQLSVQNTSVIDQKLSLGDFGIDGGQDGGQNPFRNEGGLQLGNQQKSLPYSKMENQVSRIYENDDKSMLLGSKEGSLERCVDIIDGQEENQSMYDKIKNQGLQRTSKERNQSYMHNSTFDKNNQSIPSQIFKGNQSIPFTNRSLTFEDEEDLNEMSHIDDVLNNSQNTQDRMTVSKFDILKPTEKPQRCKADSFAPYSEVESRQTDSFAANNANHQTANQFVTVSEDQTCREFISSGDEITQFDQKQFRSHIADLTIEKSGSVISGNTQKVNQSDTNILNFQNSENLNRMSIMSPQFGPVGSQSKLRANDIMAPSAPIEMSEMSNFKSPNQEDAECHEILDVNHTQEEEDNKISFEQNIEANEEPISINFESLVKCQQILKELRDILEIRPSTIQEAKKSFNSGSSQDSSAQGGGAYAIDGLSSTNRVKVQQLCQEWWDVTQDDFSIFKIGLMYEQFCQENWLRANSQNFKNLSKEEQDQQNEASKQKCACIRQSVVLSAVVIGMTAFYSMLQRPKKQGSFLSTDDEKTFAKQDFEIRGRLGQLTKIVYDQFILWQSFSIGQIAGYDLSTNQTSGSSEAKLYQSYQEHIHLLFINKKIQSEDDYLIFNTKGLFTQMPQSYYVANEENRDYQINQLNKRLQDNCYRILAQELDLQMASNNQGNFNLLMALKEIAENSTVVDFQESKNYIFEGISCSEVMPAASHSQSQVEFSAVRSSEKPEISDQEDFKASSFSHPEETDSQPQRIQYGMSLIKNFNHDENQIIHEESREESMQISKLDISQVTIQQQSDCQYYDKNGNFNDGQCCEREFQENKAKHIILKESFKSNNMQSEVSNMTNVVVLDQRVFQESTPAHLSHSRDRTVFVESTDKKDDLYDISRIDDDSKDSIQLRCSDADQKSGKLYESIDSEDKDSDPIVLKLPPSSLNDVHYQKPVSVPFLPPMSTKNGLMQKLTLVLDLDETLIHCKEIPGDQENAMMIKRPDLQYFLKEMSKTFEIVIFTAGGQEYAQAVVQQLGDSQQYIDHVLNWDHVTIISNTKEPAVVTFADNDMLDMSEGGHSYMHSNSKHDRFSKLSNFSGFEKSVMAEGISYVKDLSKLGRDLSKVIIVDNLPQNYAQHPENGICVQDWTGDNFQGDKALIELTNFLKSVVQASSKPKIDLRVTLQEYFDKYRSQLQYIS